MAGELLAAAGDQALVVIHAAGAFELLVPAGAYRRRLWSPAGRVIEVRPLGVAAGMPPLHLRPPCG